ncbi:hypothetical protein HBI81_242100 [Parastagonospora nodorum]|nr:hypothetical protein HBI74_214360 [Parastagonospora nodorum]KAH5758841.1 hypothetical protein HBI16_198190 [Parastagonospora nodorum]KAH6106778.1 hypothetical protein HBI64_234570 [Parastagonospora nodorum]KAH6511646.1 hypothetical protein HBI81_242100 [Parastagonospora nodorum]
MDIRGSVEMNWIDQAMGDGADEGSKAGPPKRNPSPSKLNTAVIALLATIDESAELGKASLPFKRPVQEVQVEVVTFKAITIRILCETIVDELSDVIRNIT